MTRRENPTASNVERNVGDFWVRSGEEKGGKRKSRRRGLKPIVAMHLFLSFLFVFMPLKVKKSIAAACLASLWLGRSVFF